MSGWKAYTSLFLFCLLSSIRDVSLDFADKRMGLHFDPALILCIFAVTAETVACLSLLTKSVLAASARISYAHPSNKSSKICDLVKVNIFTAGAFLPYFFAIGTPLGANANALIDYGMGPTLTGLTGAFFFGINLSLKYAVATFVSLTGIIVLLSGKAEGQWGLTLAGGAASMFSCVCSVMYRVYFKKLLNTGMSRDLIVFSRLLGSLLLCLLLIHFSGQAPPSYTTVGLLTLLGLFGFTAPLYLSLFVLQRVTIDRFSLYLFLLPCSILIISMMAGLSRPSYTNFLAVALVVGGVAIYEMDKR